MSCPIQLVAAIQQRQQRYAMSSLMLTTRIEIEDPYLITAPDGQPFSKFDMDMRRKVEILQYHKNANTVTKKLNTTRWVDVVRSRATRPFAKTTTVNCPTDIRVPLYNSDVPPGDTDTLYLNPNVPLYNYTNPVNDRNYNTPPINEPEFVYQVNPNVMSGFGYPGTIASVMFTPTANNTTYYLNLSIPMVLQINKGSTSHLNNNTITITPTIAIYYNDTRLYTQATIPIVLTLTTTSINTDFNITQYIGTTMPETRLNIPLDPIPYTVYTVRLLWDIDTNVTMIEAPYIIANIPPTFTPTYSSGTTLSPVFSPVDSWTFDISSIMR